MALMQYTSTYNPIALYLSSSMNVHIAYLDMLGTR
jgi:hypothetical protein